MNNGETTFGQLIAVLCRKAAEEHRKRNEPFGWDKVAEIVDMAYKQPSNDADDEAWLTELSLSPKYKGIDVWSELASCKSWNGQKGLSVGRRRFLSWLDKAEKPLDGNGRKLKRIALPEPPQWRERLTANNPICIYAPGGMRGTDTWESLNHDDQAFIAEELKRIP